MFGAVNHTYHSDTCFRSAFLHTHIHLSGRDARRNGRFVGKLSHAASRRAHALWNQWTLARTEQQPSGSSREPAIPASQVATRGANNSVPPENTNVSVGVSEQPYQEPKTSRVLNPEALLRDNGR